MRHRGHLCPVSKTVGGGNVARGFESLPLRYLQVRQPFFGCVTVSLTVVLPLTTHVAETLD
jgi:hypothetical protein